MLALIYNFFFFFSNTFFFILLQMNAIAPPLHRGMKELERSAFKKVIKTLAIKQVGLAKKSFQE